ncbi:MAG: dual specificity protein phosphatase family protein [Pseudomonadota bacterium]
MSQSGFGFSKILQRLFLGPCPRNVAAISQLVDQNVSSVVNLQSDEDMKAESIDWSSLEAGYNRHGVRIHRIPIVDLDPDDMQIHIDAAIKVVNELYDSGHSIYLHCTAGRERSPTAAIAWLVRYHNHSLSNAVEQVTSRRKCNPYLDMLNQWIKT